MDNICVRLYRITKYFRNDRLEKGLGFIKFPEGLLKRRAGPLSKRFFCGREKVLLRVTLAVRRGVGKIGYRECTYQATDMSGHLIRNTYIGKPCV